ncbi:hypothetical protein [Ralstonia pseudosolanacearum]
MNQHDQRRLKDARGLFFLHQFAWLRTAELGKLMWPDMASSRQLADRLARDWLARRLVIARDLPGSAGRALVLATAGVRLLAEQGIVAASGKDIGKLAEDGWSPPLTWRHDLLAAGILCELHRQGFSIHPETELRRHADHGVKIPDGICVRGQEVLWLEVENARKTGRMDEALVLLGELKAIGSNDPMMRPNVVTYSAAISACEKAGWVDQALALLDELRTQGQSEPALRPNVITYSAAISACMGAGQADRARWLVALAIQDGVVLPDAGYDAQANTLDFHANLVFREPTPSSRPVGVAAPVALALMRYHGHRGDLSGGTHYIVGQHGGDAIKAAVLETLNRVRPRAYVVSPTNAGMLIATAPDPHAAWSVEDDPPQSPSAAAPDALADRLRAMWPQAGASEALAAGQSDAMPIDDADAMSLDEDDDGLLRYPADPTARAAQLRDLKVRVSKVATPEDVLALVEAAGRFRAEAVERYPDASTKQLKDVFLPGSENVDSRFWRLGNMMVDCDDAAQAWQAASDHYRSARDAVLKLNLPGDFVAPLETAEAECEAQAARLDITHGLLEGIWKFKGWRQVFNEGQPTEIDSVLKPLLRALALGNAEALAALPLRDVPIQAEFNEQLNIIHGDAAQIALAGGGVLTPALLNQM